MLVAELFVAATVSAGICIGAWLHASLRKSNELAVKAPSPVQSWKKRSAALDIEAFAS